MSSRRLTALEEAEARLVFGEGLLYARVRVHEGARWTNALPRLQAWLTGRPAPTGDNAVALGHSLHFPRALRTSATCLAAGDIGDFAWLIHELTHVWQAERVGARYALQAIRLHLNADRDIYAYGGAPTILVAIASGSNLSAYNVEQQAEIARDYYCRRRLGQPTHSWEPLLMAFRRG